MVRMWVQLLHYPVFLHKYKYFCEYFSLFILWPPALRILIKEIFTFSCLLFCHLYKVLAGLGCCRMYGSAFSAWFWALLSARLLPEQSWILYLCQSQSLGIKAARIRNSELLCWVKHFKADVFLVPFRYRVAIWVCLAIAEQHKPGPCNSRSNRQCNLLIHPSLVFVLKCLSFYPLRWDGTSSLVFSLFLEFSCVLSALHTLWWSWGSAAIKHVTWWNVLPWVLCYLCVQILWLLFAKGRVPRKLRTSFSFFLLPSVNTRVSVVTKTYLEPIGIFLMIYYTIIQ